MNLNDYQTHARKTAMGNSLDHFVHGLTEEAGEVAGVMKRFHRGDDAYRNLNDHGTAYEISRFAKEKLLYEIGDVLWYIAMIADQLETPLVEVAQRNINKLADRKVRNVIIGSGDNR